MEDSAQSETPEEEKKKKRLLSIDVFKGITILLMVFVNTLSIFNNVPAWTKHPVDYGLTYVDFIAPFFVFMMALNFKSSFLKRVKKNGKAKTYFHSIERNLLFIFLGLLININITEEGIALRWGTLQYLGTAGLVLLSLIELSPLIRLVISITLMSIHQFLLETSVGILIYDGIEGGPYGVLSWISMLLLSSVLAEGLLNKKVKLFFLYGGIACLLVSIPTYFLWGFSRQRITLPFIFLTIGAAAMAFYALYLIFEVFSQNHPLLQQENYVSMLGRNAFFLYILHLMLIIFMFFLAVFNPLFNIVFLIGLLNTFIIWIIGVFLYKNEIFIVI